MQEFIFHGAIIYSNERKREREENNRTTRRKHVCIFFIKLFQLHTISCRCFCLSTQSPQRISSFDLLTFNRFPPFVFQFFQHSLDGVPASHIEFHFVLACNVRHQFFWKQVSDIHSNRCRIRFDLKVVKWFGLDLHQNARRKVREVLQEDLFFFTPVVRTRGSGCSSRSSSKFSPWHVID